MAQQAHLPSPGGAAASKAATSASKTAAESAAATEAAATQAAKATTQTATPTPTATAPHTGRNARYQADHTRGKGGKNGDAKQLRHQPHRCACEPARRQGAERAPQEGTQHRTAEIGRAHV